MVKGEERRSEGAKERRREGERGGSTIDTLHMH